MIDLPEHAWTGMEHTQELDLPNGTAKLIIQKRDTSAKVTDDSYPLGQRVLISNVEFVPSTELGPRKRRKIENIWFCIGREEPLDCFPEVDVRVISEAISMMQEGECVNIELFQDSILIGTLRLLVAKIDTDCSARLSASSYEEALSFTASECIRNIENQIIVSSDSGLGVCTDCWVDRSQYIPGFIQRRQSVFLRPRRLGKTVFLQTIALFFRNPDDFAELQPFLISRMTFRVALSPERSLVWNPDNRAQFGAHYFPVFPVARFDFSVLLVPEEYPNFVDRVRFAWKERINKVYLEATRLPIEKRMEKGRAAIDISDNRPETECLDDLITWLADESETKKVVLLVDEYDSFLNAHRGSKHLPFIKELHEGFYRCFKARWESIICAVVTGQTRWSLDSLFSGANQLYDFTLTPFTAHLCGLTEPEVKAHVEARYPNEHECLLPLLRKNLNGYRFCPTSEIKVYSPYYVQLATSVTTRAKIGLSEDGEKPEIPTFSFVQSEDSRSTAVVPSFKEVEATRKSDVIKRVCAGMIQEAWWHTNASVCTMFQHVAEYLQMPTTMLLNDLKLESATTREGVAAKLFYCGFCTIVGANMIFASDDPELAGEIQITLDFPNKLAEEFMQSDLLKALVGENKTVCTKTADIFSDVASEIGEALDCAPPDWMKFFTQFNLMLGAIPENPQSTRNRSEGYFQALLCLLAMFYKNWEAQGEETASEGRCDVHLFPQQRIRANHRDKRSSQVLLELKVSSGSILAVNSDDSRCVITRCRPRAPVSPFGADAEEEASRVALVKSDSIADNGVQQIKDTNYSLTMRSLYKGGKVTDVYRIAVVASKATGRIEVVLFEGGMQYHASKDKQSGDVSFVTSFLQYEFYNDKLMACLGAEKFSVFKRHEFNLLSFLMADVEDYKTAGFESASAVQMIPKVRKTLPCLDSIVLCRRAVHHDTKTLVGDLVDNASGVVEFLLTWLSDFQSGNEQSSTTRNNQPVSLGLRLAFKAVLFFYRELDLAKPVSATSDK